MAEGLVTLPLTIAYLPNPEIVRLPYKLLASVRTIRHFSGLDGDYAPGLPMRLVNLASGVMRWSEGHGCYISVKNRHGTTQFVEHNPAMTAIFNLFPETGSQVRRIKNSTTTGFMPEGAVATVLAQMLSEITPPTMGTFWPYAE